MPALDPPPESRAEALIAGAISRIGPDPARLEQLGLLCDLYSRIPVAQQRDLVISLTAMVALGEPD